MLILTQNRNDDKINQQQTMMFALICERHRFLICVYKRSKAKAIPHNSRLAP
jgi:hypothetical protein